MKDCYSESKFHKKFSLIKKTPSHSQGGNNSNEFVVVSCFGYVYIIKKYVNIILEENGGRRQISTAWRKTWISRRERRPTS